MWLFTEYKKGRWNEKKNGMTEFLQAKESLQAEEKFFTQYYSILCYLFSQ